MYFECWHHGEVQYLLHAYLYFHIFHNNYILLIFVNRKKCYFYMNFCSERSKMRLQIEMVHLRMVSNWKPSRSSWGTGKFHWYMNSGSMVHNLKGFSVSCACSHGMTNQHLREARSSLQRPSSQQGEMLTTIGLVSVLRRLPWTAPLLPHYQLHLTCYF